MVTSSILKPSTGTVCSRCGYGLHPLTPALLHLQPESRKCIDSNNLPQAYQSPLQIIHEDGELVHTGRLDSSHNYPCAGVLLSYRITALLSLLCWSGIVHEGVASSLCPTDLCSTWIRFMHWTDNIPYGTLNLSRYNPNCFSYQRLTTLHIFLAITPHDN